MAEQKNKKPHRQKSDDVTYEPAAPIYRKQVFLVIACMIGAAIAIFLSLSIFFEVDQDEFKVQGNKMYRADTIWEASGLQDGDSLLTFGKAKVASRIMQELPYVKSVRIQITLPDTVTIFVEEHKVYLVAQDTDDAWWFLSTEGKVLEKASEKEAQKRTVLEGFQIQSPVVGQMAVAAEPAPDEIEPDVPSFVLQTNAERLSTALELSATLEKCGILGDIDSIYVENLNDIRFWYGERFLVKLGDAGLMAEKVALVDGAISTQLGSRETGILHVSSENGIKIEFEYRIFE